MWKFFACDFFGRQNLPGDLEHEGAECGGLGGLAGLGRPVILASWKVDRQVRIGRLVRLLYSDDFP